MRPDSVRLPSSVSLGSGAQAAAASAVAAVGVGSVGFSVVAGGSTIGVVSTTGQAEAIDGPVMTSKSFAFCRFMMGLLVKGNRSMSGGDSMNREPENTKAALQGAASGCVKCARS